MVPLDSPEFYSNVFLVLKASGGWPSVIDLKRLNIHIFAPHLHMFSKSSVLITVRKGDYAFKIDLEDSASTYLSIQTAGSTFVCIREQSLPVQSTSLRSEHSSSVIYTFGHTVAGYLHLQGISVNPYFDDWLVHHPDRQVLLSNQSRVPKFIEM